MTWQYWILVVGLITGGGLIFFVMAKLGERLIQKNDVLLQESYSEKTLSSYDNKIHITD